MPINNMSQKEKKNNNINTCSPRIPNLACVVHDFWNVQFNVTAQFKWMCVCVQIQLM